MKIWLGAVVLLMMVSVLVGGTLDPAQRKFYHQYEKQKNIPNPANQLVNADPEPDLTTGFKQLFNGKDLTGWTPKGGSCTFKVEDGSIVGTVVKGSPSTFLCTDKEYGNFIFSCEMKWLVDGNSGIQFRSAICGKNESVCGPQYEMEGFKRGRGWSGGIYGQGCGGWFYPLWLEEHRDARAALKHGWNRVTIMAQGDTVKTWINGVPAANWITKDYKKGVFGLQIHQGHAGEVAWRNIKIKPIDAN
jgi:hypothetical protein